MKSNQSGSHVFKFYSTDSTDLASSVDGVPWAENFVIGSGVSAVTGDVTSSALKSTSSTPKGSMSARSAFDMVVNESQMAQKIESAAKITYNMDGVDLSASTEFLTKIRYSSLSVSLIAEYHDMYTEYSEIDNPTLNDEAAKLLQKDPYEFTQRYGDYFIAGFISGSSFVSVYQCTANREEDMTNFLASLGGSIPKVFSAEGYTAFERATTQYNISVHCDSYMHGFKKDAEAPVIPTDPAGVLKALEWFIANREGVPLKVKLLHFSNIAPGLPRTVPISPDVFADVKILYLNTWQIKAGFYSLPSVYQSAYRDEFDAFTVGVIANQSRFTMDDALRESYLDQSKILETKIQNVLDRQDFYWAVTAKVGTEPVRGLEIKEDVYGPHFWSYGYSSYPKSDAVQIYEETLVFKERGAPGRRKKTLEFGPDANYLIVGWMVHSIWVDGRNGWWSKAVDQSLLRDQGAVYIRSHLSRGCDWAVTFYFVDAADYQFEEALSTANNIYSLPADPSEVEGVHYA